MALTRAIALAALSILFLAPRGTPAEKEILARGKYIEVPAGADLSRSDGRRICTALDRMFDEAMKAVRLDPQHVFPSGVLRPRWLRQVPDDQRLVATVAGDADSADPGATYLPRLTAGKIEIAVAPPKWDEAQEARARGAIGAVIAGNTLGDSAPLWLRYGIADALGETDGVTNEIALAHQKALAESEFEIELGLLFTHVDEAKFLASRGRPLSWAVVRLLIELDRNFVLELYHQTRLLAAHAFVEPRAGAIRKELTEVARESLSRGGVEPAELGEALKRWVEADFPRGYQLARQKWARPLRNLASLTRYGVIVSRVEYSERPSPSIFGDIVWNFPWPTSMQMWAGRRGVGEPLPFVETTSTSRGWLTTHEQWSFSAEKQGDKSTLILTRVVPPPGDMRPEYIDRVGLALPRDGGPIIVFLVAVRSPSGVGYYYVKEWGRR
jgi:hypothetical protein